jgi:glycosyltransferase involved in cell wall biosynthesis
VAVTLHGINVGKRFFDDSKRRERFRSALNAADRVILVGEPLREFFADLIGRTDHFRVVPNGFVLPSNVANPSVLERGRKLELISVSNLTEGKGIEVTIQALGQVWQRGLRAWTYTVVGDGPSKPQLRRLAQSLGIDTNVRFTGAVPHEHVYACLAAADVFVLPSYREAFGIAYLEAMAAGLLAIGVRGQGPGAFISDEVTGLLVAPRDPDDLGLRLTDILSDPTKFRGIAAEGSRKARSGYTWTRHAEILTGVYDEMLAETP